MEINRRKLNKSFLIGSWALYDLANQFFALNIVSLYFIRWVTLEMKAPEVLYSLSFGISMFIVAILAPILGAISDITHRHKPFLIYCTVISITFTIVLSFTKNLTLALIFFAIANFGCQEAVVFYNALLVKISPRPIIGLVSGLGKMFGYVGAILALYFTKPVIIEKGYRATFFITGILFLIFSLPCMIFIKERPRRIRNNLLVFLKKENLIEVLRRLRSTFQEGSELWGISDFFKAAFFGLGVVNIIILFMSVYATRVFGLTEIQVINLIAFSTIFALVGSIASGVISDYFGYKRTLLGVFFLWCICFLAGGLLRQPFHWLIGALAGLSLGSTWVVSRALVIKLVPAEKVGEIFGLFNLVGYVSAIVGPLYWGLILLILSPYGEIGYRLALLSLILFMAIGFIFLLRIPNKIKNE